MTTVQFIYMMGVLWLIFAGVILRPEENPDELVNILAKGGIVLGFAHIGLAIAMFVWQFFRQLT